MNVTTTNIPSVETTDIAIIVGTRPEAIKIWPVLLEAQQKNISTSLISTQQQKHLLSSTLSELGLTPDVICEVPNESGDISNFLSTAILKLVEVLKEVNPRVVLVQGDTGTALAGAIAAHNLQIPVGHIEAGLRSGDLENPWPEEGNRRLIDSISSFLWFPTKVSQIHVLGDQTEEVVGNTSIDALRLCLENHPIGAPSEVDKYILVTLHRRESFGENMISALEEIKKLSVETQIKILFIEHPNPRVREALNQVDFPKGLVKVTPPVPYPAFISLLANSLMVISDSGGIQEEATALGVPLLVVREKTERQEIFTLNSEVLVGSNGSNLLISALDILQNLEPKKSGAKIRNQLFGDGFAAQRIISTLENTYDFAPKRDTAN